MTRQSQPSSVASLRVRIRIGAPLDAGWSAWFDGLDVRPLGNGETSLTGTVIDQPSLHGLLTRIRDLGVPLLGLEIVEPGGVADGPVPDETGGTPGRDPAETALE